MPRCTVLIADKEHHLTKQYLVKSLTIQQRIFTIRGQRVMIDRDLAELYGVETKYLNRQVKRNKQRFPKRYVFQISKKELDELVTNWHRFESLKHSSSRPYAFTEHGVSMLSGVLNSPRAVDISLFIIDTFVQLRRAFFYQKELAYELSALRMRVDKHDEELVHIIEAIQELMVPPDPPPKRRIGFGVEEPKASYKVRKRA